MKAVLTAGLAVLVAGSADSAFAAPAIAADECRKMANAAFSGFFGRAQAAAIGLKAAWKEMRRD